MNILFMTLVPGSLYKELADEFIKNGHSVTFVTPTQDNSHLGSIGNIKVIYIQTGKMLNVGLIRKALSNFMFPNYAAHGVKKFVNPFKYDIILLSTPSIGYYKAIQWVIKNNPKIKFYLILRDIHPEGAKLVHLDKIWPLYKYYQHQAQTIYNMADIVGCMSPHSVKLIQNNYLPNHKDKVKLLPNWGLDIPFSNPDPSCLLKYGLQNKFFVIYGGNMGITQNLDHIIDLAYRKRHLKNVVFLFIGEGTERERLKKRVKELALDNVVIKNQLPREDYDQILKNASLGLITLHPNAFFANIPSKTISYMQNKIPILASIDIVGDYNEYIIEKSKAGLWAPADDLDALENIFDKMYYNPQLRKEMGENGYNHFKKYFTVGSTYNQIMNDLKL